MYVLTSYLRYKRHKLTNVSRGKTSLLIKNVNFSKPPVASSSIFIIARLCNVIVSSSLTFLGGMSVKASRAAVSI
jgi:hypothetical protein